MAGISFGSVGDIIAVGEIAWSIAKALSSSRGSAKEYQSLAKELQLFNKALLQVVAVWQNYAECEELRELGKLTREVIGEWKETLCGFQGKLERKYGKSLGTDGGSGNWVRDAGRKVAWLREKEEVGELRAKLHTFSDTMMMLSDAAQKKSDRLTEKEQAFRVRTVNQHLQESVKLAEMQLSRLKIVDDKMDKQLQTSALVLSTVKGGIVTLSQVRSMVFDIKSVLELFHKLMMSQETVPRGLGGHWKQAPVRLELATGREIPIPLEWVNSWDMFDTILSGLFKNQPAAQRKIQRKEFAIEEADTGRDVNRTWELDMSFRPGQKVDMSMIFPANDSNVNTCPRCKTVSTASGEVRTQCVSCKMWFQRVEELTQEEPELVPISIPHAFSVGNKAAAFPSGPVLGPADFQRVRLMWKSSVTKDRRQERQQEEMDPQLYAQLVATNTYLAEQQQRLQQQLASAQAAAQQFQGMSFGSGNQTQQPHYIPPLDTVQNVYHQQQDKQDMQPLITPVKGAQPGTYSAYNPMTGQQSYFMDSSAQQEENPTETPGLRSIFSSHQDQKITHATQDDKNVILDKELEEDTDDHIKYSVVSKAQIRERYPQHQEHGEYRVVGIGSVPFRFTSDRVSEQDIGKLPRAQERRPADYDVENEQLSHADAKLFYERSESQRLQRGSGKPLIHEISGEEEEAEAGPAFLSPPVVGRDINELLLNGFFKTTRSRPPE